MKKIIVIILLASTLLLANNYLPFDHNLDTKEATHKIHHHHHHDHSVSSIGIVALWTIRFYQLFLSPQDGPNCIYYPTCSMYGYLSVQKYGPIKGILMTGDRWLRCNPFNYPGNDSPDENYFFQKTKKRSLK